MTERRDDAEPAAAEAAQAAAAQPAQPPPSGPAPDAPGPLPPVAYGPPSGPFQPAWRPPREPWINPNRRAHVALVAVLGAAAVFVVGVAGGWVAGHRHHGFGPERGYPGYYRPGPPVLVPWPERSYLPPPVPFPPVPSTSASAVPTPTTTATSSTR
jgi:hypothetical protein